MLGELVFEPYSTTCISTTSTGLELLLTFDREENSVRLELVLKQNIQGVQ